MKTLKQIHVKILSIFGKIFRQKLVLTFFFKTKDAISNRKTESIENQQPKDFFKSIHFKQMTKSRLWPISSQTDFVPRGTLTDFIPILTVFVPNYE